MSSALFSSCSAKSKPEYIYNFQPHQLHSCVKPTCRLSNEWDDFLIRSMATLQASSGERPFLICSTIVWLPGCNDSFKASGTCSSNFRVYKNSCSNYG